jgi:hypothetical protein
MSVGQKNPLDTSVSSVKKIQAGESPNWAEPKSNVEGGAYCVQCGRKTGSNPWYVEVIDGGDIRLQDGTEAVQDAGYMGCYPVGNECAKSFAPNTLIKMEAK